MTLAFHGTADATSDLAIIAQYLNDHAADAIATATLKRIRRRIVCRTHPSGGPLPAIAIERIVVEELAPPQHRAIGGAKTGVFAHISPLTGA